MRKLDPNEVYTRALARPDAASELDDVELLVYAVKELENYDDMEGWEAFFSGSGDAFGLTKSATTASSPSARSRPS